MGIGNISLLVVAATFTIDRFNRLSFSEVANNASVSCERLVVEHCLYNYIFSILSVMCFRLTIYLLSGAKLHPQFSMFVNKIITERLFRKIF